MNWCAIALKRWFCCRWRAAKPALLDRLGRRNRLLKKIQVTVSSHAGRGETGSSSFHLLLLWYRAEYQAAKACINLGTELGVALPGTGASLWVLCARRRSDDSGHICSFHSAHYVSARIRCSPPMSVGMWCHTFWLAARCTMSG
jgi:hypothetical protein